MGWYGQGRGTLAIVLPTPVITTVSLPNATAGVAYSAVLSASNGSPPYTYRLISGQDGNGFPALNSSGVLSGTPTGTETLTLVVQVTDSLGQPSAPTSLTLTVNAGGASNFYISPNGVDTNSGSLSSPWSLSAINSATARNKYAGNNLWFIGDQGTFQNYNTGSGQQSIYSFLQQQVALNGGGTSTCLFNIQGGSATSPTYVASCNSSGVYTSRLALIDCSQPGTGDLITTSTLVSIPGIIGQGDGIATGLTLPTSFGNLTIDGISITNFPYSAICYRAGSANLSYGTFINNHLYGCHAQCVSNGNPGALNIQAPNATNVLVRNNLIHDLTTNSGGTNYPYGSNGIMVITSGGMQLTATCNTCYNCMGLTLKDSPTVTEGTPGVQGYIGYNYLEVSSFGSPPYGTNNPGTAVITGVACWQYITGPSQSLTFDHNIFVGTTIWKAEATVPTGNQGSVTFTNNTWYLPVASVAISQANVDADIPGTWTAQKNLFYSLAAYPGNFIQLNFNGNGLGTNGTLWNYNYYGNNFPMQMCQGSFSPVYSFPGTWQSTLGLDLQGISGGNPFAGTPTQAEPATFALTSAAKSSMLAANSAIWGAVDGSSSPIGLLYPGCNFSATLEITTSSLPNATVGTTYSQGLSTTGGTPPYTYNKVSITPNTQLAWTVSANGAIQGTPQAAETSTIVVQVNDSAGLTAQATLTVTAVASGTLAVVTSSVPNATSDGMYAVQCIAQGGVPPYTWTTTAAAPLYMERLGLLHGVLTSTPAAYTVTVTDSSGATATSGSLSTTVDSVLRIAQIDNVDGFLRLPDGFASTLYGSYSPTIQAFGGTAPYSFAVTSGALPSGLSLATSGAISGTIGSKAGAASGVITVTDSASPTPNTATATFLMNVFSKNQVSRPAYNTGSGFFVDGNGYLRDPNGYLFQMRGWNRDHYDQAPTGMQLTHPNSCKDGTGATNGTVAISTYTNDMVNNLLNYYNFPLYPIFQIPSTNGVTSGDSSTTDLSSCINYWCTNISTYMSAVGNNWAPGTGNEWGPAGRSASSAWLNAHLPCMGTISAISGTTITVSNTSVSNPFQNCPFGWIQGAGGITNQMVLLSSPGGSSGAWTITSSVSLSGYTSGGTLGGGSIGAMRAAGWTTPIKVDAGNYGNNAFDIITYAAQIQAADPQQNVIFDLHLYQDFTDFNCEITSVSTGTSTVLHLNNSSSTAPYSNQFNGVQPTQVVIQGATGTGWTAMNGTWATTTFGGSSGAWTVTIPFNSTGLTAGNYSANSARVFDSVNPVILGQTMAALRASGVCTYWGEFGPYNNPDGVSISPMEVIAAAEANQINWCYWAWDDNTGSGVTGFPMIQGTPPPHYTAPSSLSPSGQPEVMHPRMSCNVLATAAPVFL